VILSARDKKKPLDRGFGDLPVKMPLTAHLSNIEDPHLARPTVFAKVQAAY